MLDINKKKLTEDNNFDKFEKEDLDNARDIPEKYNLKTKREIKQLKHTIEKKIELEIAEKETEETEKKLDKVFEVTDINPEKPNGSISEQYSKKISKHLKGRPEQVQKKATEIEQEVLSTIDTSDKDQNFIARGIGVVMKKIMERES